MLLRLQAKIEQLLQRTGLPPEPRKFKPHVTLARFRGGTESRLDGLPWQPTRAFAARPSWWPRWCSTPARSVTGVPSIIPRWPTSSPAWTNQSRFPVDDVEAGGHQDGDTGPDTGIRKLLPDQPA